MTLDRLFLSIFPLRFHFIDFYHSYLEHDMKRARQCLQNPFSQMMNQNFDGEFRAFFI